MMVLVGVAGDGDDNLVDGYDADPVYIQAVVYNLAIVVSDFLCYR